MYCFFLAYQCIHLCVVDGPVQVVYRDNSFRKQLEARRRRQALLRRTALRLLNGRLRWAMQLK
jgi:hypothetical protein